jgi:hypothetical protein
VQRLPAEAEYVLFHYRRSVTQIQAIQEYPSVAKPTPDQLMGFVTVLDLPDPRSSARKGVLLLKRKPAGQAHGMAN